MMLKEMMMAVVVMVGLLVAAVVTDVEVAVVTPVENVVTPEPLVDDMTLTWEQLTYAEAKYDERVEYVIDLTTTTNVIARYAGKGKVYLGDGLYITMHTDGTFVMDREPSVTYGEVFPHDGIIIYNTELNYGHSEDTLTHITYMLEHTEEEYYAYIRNVWDQQ